MKESIRDISIDLSIVSDTLGLMQEYHFDRRINYEKGTLEYEKMIYGLLRTYEKAASFNCLIMDKITAMLEAMEQLTIDTYTIGANLKIMLNILILLQGYHFDKYINPECNTEECQNSICGLLNTYETAGTLIAMVCDKALELSKDVESFEIMGKCPAPTEI